MYKILFIITQAFNPSSGGVQHTTWKLGKYFSEKNCEVHYYSFALNGHTNEYFGNLTIANSLGKDNNVENIDQLKQLIFEKEFNIIINQMPYRVPIRTLLSNLKNDINFLSIACLRNTLLSFQINAKEELLKVTNGRYRFILTNPIVLKILKLRNYLIRKYHLKSILECHDLYVLLTAANILELQHYVKDYLKQKVRVIPNSIPHYQSQLPPKSKVLLHVGRLSKGQKRSELLLDVWKKVVPAVNDWKFIIVGDGPYLNDMEKKIKKEKIDNVELLGRQVPDSYYKDAGIFIMTSAYEGFPNVILEAQSFGCVPVAFNSYGAIECIVKHGQNSILTSAFNTSEMAKAIIDLIENDAYRYELQIKALNNASNYHIEKVGQYWFDLFEENLQ